MFSMFKGRAIWRKKDEGDDTNRSQPYSPFAKTPEAEQRVPGQSVDDDDEDEDGEERSPGWQGNHPTSYFDRRVGEAAEDEEIDEDEDEDEDGEDAIETPLLPIFSAAHLDKLPLYNITHAIRLLIVQKCETTLSWDQLRSPQISQFLVKPIQSQIRTNHFNRATLCALIANCLQFQKEAQLNPGSVGVSKTRALISELLAMRLVKEFTTRELIDALSYDFDPLQGMIAPTVTGATPAVQDLQARRTQARGARVSTIEVAIRAQAKRFLAYPLVVQHLEAIWAGTVVFHSEADNLHRKPSNLQEQRDKLQGGYGTVNAHSPSALPADSILSRKAQATKAIKSADKTVVRRSVTLYDPHDASLFKLSRLRVPRYRQVFSTISFATMLGLFLAVLVDRSLYITPLEVVFWFWSAGYMLDEVVGFTEQGFGLYILSFWNAFDLGILLLFITYYCLRLYGIVLAESGKHHIANMAYDVLASTAVLLFPRLFSVLDHYRYFSQLLIAFRMMAQDLAAILVLILISCSGIFVAFTLSFSDEKTDSNAVAYALFQILMGFTPAAWEKWAGYNILGKAVMAIFLIICHFLIVTILITVLTNSFMAVVQNSNDEHQFLFAVNTISMVKSDALFSYIAPANVVGWLMSPLRYLMPFRQYVKLNRTIIKVTHFPVLFIIFSYERVILAHSAYEPTDLVEKPLRARIKPLAFSMNKGPDAFSPGHRLREPSVISFHKDRALDEVFRRPFRGSTMRTTTREAGPERRNSLNVVDQWMQEAEVEGGASPPMEQPRSVLERLEHRRPNFRRARTVDYARQSRVRDVSTATKSMMSDPDPGQRNVSRRPRRIDEEDETAETSTDALPLETDADDEVNEMSDHLTPAIGESAISIREKGHRTPADESDEEYFVTPTASKSPAIQMSAAARARLQATPGIMSSGSKPVISRRQSAGQVHGRNASSGTVLFAPQQADDSSASHLVRFGRPVTAKNSGGTSTPTLPLLTGQRTPKTKPAPPAKARPIMPPRQKTMPDLKGAGAGASGLAFLDAANRGRRQPSFNARALDLASEIGDNKWAGPSNMIDVGGISGMPASFSEQMLRERDWERERERARDEERRRGEDEEKGMVNRIMLSRMYTLEAGFKEVLKEIKDLSQNAGSSRRESEAEQPRRRPGIETTNSSQSHGQAGGPPRTPIGRIAGNEGRARKSPRKIQRRGTKGKEVTLTGLSSSVRAGESREMAPSPESVKSVVSREGGRPGTAFRSPMPGTDSEH